MVGLDDLGCAIVTSDRDFAFASQFRRAFDDFNFVLFHQEGDSLAHAVGYAARAFNHTVEIDFMIFYRNAIICCMVDVIEHLRTFQQRFGWDTTPVQTHTA